MKTPSKATSTYDIVTDSAKKLSPNSNPEWAWCYCFLPALFIYIALLMHHLNAKPTVGHVEVLHPDFHSIFPSGSSLQVIASGMGWTEGPVWVEDSNCECSYLLFSDTITNRIWRWEEGKGLFTVGKTLHTTNSGCSALNKDWCHTLKEPGSNGLSVYLGSKRGDLVVCQHGDRSVSIIYENGTSVVLASHYRGKRLNSPNDLVWSLEGHLYFTDPPYGLINHAGAINDQQLTMSGVFMLDKDAIAESLRTGAPSNNLRLVDDSLSRPNGLAFSPDFQKLYVSNSDATYPLWKVFDVTENGDLQNGRIFSDASHLRDSDMSVNNNPDGLKVDTNGNVIATGPGGVLVLSSSGVLLGRLILDSKVSNVGFGGDGYLYITSADKVLRIRTTSTPASAFRLK